MPAASGRSLWQLLGLRCDDVIKASLVGAGLSMIFFIGPLTLSAMEIYRDANKYGLAEALRVDSDSNEQL